ncbi:MULTISPECIES: helix-turn-helix domain-containing protein [unclassified Streptomyces]|uniref:helix-turn-helix domain-containing protein n=1 Tax=unclassified Streptomyces TaxID=2593676 RepID=UPI003701AF42
MMSSYRAIEALLAEHTPLPPPAERSRLRNHLGITPTRLAQALGVDTTTLHAWEEGLAEPETPVRAAYAYFLAQAHTLGTYRAQAIAESHPTAPAETTDTAQETLPQHAPCVLCGKPATQHVAGYPQHLTADECAEAEATPRPSQHARQATTPGRNIPQPRRSGPRPSAAVQDPVSEAVAAALAAHDGDQRKAITALTQRAIPDAMLLFNASRVGGRYDVVHHPALPPMLRKPGPRQPDLIWEARLNWQRPTAPEQTDPVAALDINGAYLSALKTHLPLGQLQPTSTHPHDRRRAGIHLITPPAWEHDAYLPNPLGDRQEPGPVWITEPTLRLLLRLAGPKYALCDPPAIHESYTSGCTENLLEKFRTTLRDARARALAEHDTLTLDYVKVLYAKFVSTMGESTHNRELRRPDWIHMIHSQAFANLWSKAYKAHTEGLTLVRVCGTDELHLQGDWRRVFPEGRDLSQVKLKETYELAALYPQVQAATHTACNDPYVEKRRYEYAGGRYVGCRTCGGDLCTSCRTAHLRPSKTPYEYNDDNVCNACRQDGPQA